MKQVFAIILIISSLLACNSSNKNNKSTDNKTVIINTKGYELMQQKCFICHMEKPDMSKKASMIAPPMMMVQEHYKPNYKTKEQFVQAIKAFVLNPQKKASLMPGAVRKFNLMPKLGYSNEDIELIVETLFDINFGAIPEKQKESKLKLQLNNGEKWKVKPESMAAINQIIKKLSDFQSDNITNYNQLGKEVFDNAKIILLDTDYKDDILDQIHNFFGSVEGNIHALEATESIDEAQKLIEKMKKQFAEFPKYFE